MLKYEDRIEVVKPKLSWNGKRIMAKVGHKGTVLDNESATMPDYNIFIKLDGHRKGMWIRPSNLKKIDA